MGTIEAPQGIVGGMSGSPILVDGSAIGVVVSSSGGLHEIHAEGGPNPWLVSHLPGWLLHELGFTVRKRS
jgi:SpoIVB peptidase S55